MAAGRGEQRDPARLTGVNARLPCVAGLASRINRVESASPRHVRKSAIAEVSLRPSQQWRIGGDRPFGRWPFFMARSHAMTAAEAVPLLTVRVPSKLRWAIGWIAVYALALQTILSGIVPHSAIASDQSLRFDPTAIICLTSHGGDTGSIPGDEGPAPHAGNHCTLCASASPPLPAAQGGDWRAVERTGSERVVPRLLLIPPFSKIASRPGGPRAPPMVA